MTAVLLGLLAGLATTAQAGINTQARKVLRSPLITAGVNFGLALLTLAVFLLATEHGINIPVREIAGNPPWIWLGGVCAVIIVSLNIVCFPRLGAAGNAMVVNFGQIVTGLVIDHFGLFGSETVRMSMMRLSGALLVLAGMMLVIREKGGSRAGSGGAAGSDAGQGIPVLYVALALIDGIACSVQIAVNGTLRTAVDSVSKATMVSMSVGLICTAAVIAVLLILKGSGGLFDPLPAEGLTTDPKWWMFTGGWFALTVVSGNAAAGPVIGTGLATILNVTGMMAGGLVIDAAGFLGAEKKPVTLRKLAGMLITAAGTVMISLL